MTTIQTWCRRCGREFVADRRAIVAGSWRLCRDCREAPSPLGPPTMRTEKRGVPE